MKTPTRVLVVLVVVLASLPAMALADPGPACGNMASFGAMSKQQHEASAAQAPWAHPDGPPRKATAPAAEKSAPAPAKPQVAGKAEGGEAAKPAGE